VKGGTVKGATTVSVASDPLLPEEDDSREVPALVIAWSAEEPGRVGEVAFTGPLSASLVFGRGDDGAPDRMRFFRQRPQKLEATGPIEGSAISRRQLVVRAFAAGVEVERVGRCPLWVNGIAAEKAFLTPGDTALLKGPMLLYCTRRMRKLTPLRYFPEDAWAPFGETDALGMLGESSAMWRLRDQIAFAAKSASHVLLRGDSGTGKELAARAIHRLSTRVGKPIVARNAATFPTGLIDAELFGNAKNYPNAGMPERPGLIGQASGGTLFLDEIGELPREMQAHLLRVLDAGGEYQRLGEATPRQSDLRLIGATNRAASSLKHDLLARLAVRIEMPPLDARREDIPLLVRHLVLQTAKQSPAIGARFVGLAQRRPEPRVDARLIDAMLRRRYVGNVRELDSLLLAAMEASPSDVVAFVERDVVVQPESRPSLAPLPPSPEPTADAIRACIEREGGNVRRAADALGLQSRYVLYRLMRKHGIEIGKR
jgi:two-component system nitrogen regulation response regulator GlnG/two-component system response regulator HydG